MFGVKKVPVILQMEMVECGAASLGMILAYFGKWLPLEKLRSDCGVSRDGSNARSLLRAARGYGLKAEGFKVEPKGLADMAPAIIHWNFSHFLVFKGFRGGYAYLNDPGCGSIKVTAEEFSRSFTGIALTFSRTPDFVADGNQTSILSFVRKRLVGAKEAFFFTLIIGILTAFVGLLQPLFSQVFMDNLLSGQNSNWKTPFLLAMTGLVIFKFLSLAVEGIYKWRFAGSMSFSANAGFLWQVFHLPIDFFSQRYAGDIISRQQSNQTITHTLVNTLAPLLINIMLLVLYLIIMMNYNVLLACVGIGVVFVNLLTMKFVAAKRNNLARGIEQSQGKFHGVTMSCLENMETIKAVGGERGFFEFWSGYFAKKNNALVSNSIAGERMNLLPTILSQLTNNIVLLLGVGLILNGDFTIGMLMAFQGFMSSFLQPVGELQNTAETMMGMRSQMERVEDILKYPRDTYETDINNSGSGKLGGCLELKNVTFGYNPHVEPLIRDFSLTLSPGKSVALVGASGCGKSTIAKLINGLYRPWQGEILFDGRPKESISHQEFVNSVAVIDQNVVLFDDTIAANVKMWDNSIEDFTMMIACNDAQIREDIVMRPEGFGAHLIKGGQNFSGGQRQRIEIATALAREPVILIMDEATSALDANTEKLVMHSIRTSGVTLVIVAHRLSTIRDCDEIIVMDKGRIADRGTHEELMLRDGLYKDLMADN